MSNKLRIFTLLIFLSSAFASCPQNCLSCFDENLHTNHIVSVIFLFVIVSLVSIISIAPTIICSLLCFIVFLEWPIHLKLHYRPNSKSQQINEQKLNFCPEGKCIDNWIKIQMYLMRSMKIITCLMISCVMLIDSDVIAMIIITVVMIFVLFLCYLVCYFLYKYAQKTQKITPQAIVSQVQVTEDYNPFQNRERTQSFDGDIIDVIIGKKLQADIKQQPSNT